MDKRWLSHQLTGGACVMSLFKKMKNNKAGDVGIIGMILIFMSAMLVAMVLDMFTSMLAKEYVINALQVAEMNALISGVETNQELYDGFAIDTQDVARTFASEIRERISEGPTTPFDNITYPSSPQSLWVGVNTFESRQISAYIRAHVLFQPKRFIRNPVDLFNYDAEQPRISVIVASSVYKFRA